MGVTFTMKFDMDNAAFDDGDDYATHAANMLVHVAHRVRQYKTGGTIVDVNGNKIGSWKLR